MSKTIKKANINVDVGAKANLDVRVSTEIPARSSGRLIDAVTDMFRPFSERRGLKADQIRLQREDVLLEIAKKAQHRIAVENLTTHPLPNKFLIPFMEKASLEDGDSILMDRWADLLAGSTSDPSKAHPKYVQILSEMTLSEAILLRKLIFNRIKHESTPQMRRLNLNSVQQRIFDAPLTYAQTDLAGFLRNTVGKTGKTSRKKLIDTIYDQIEGLFACSGVALIEAMVHDKKGKGFWSGDLGKDEEGLTLYIENNESKSVDILESLNIIRRFQFELEIDGFGIEVFFIAFTDLGVDFAISCDRELFKIVGGEQTY